MWRNIIVILIIVGIGILIYMTKDKTMKNSEMLTQVGMDTVSEDVNYFGNVEGLYVRPKTDGEYPGVVMIHENRGLRPEIRDMAKVLAGEGYHVVAVSVLDGVVDTQEQARALTSKFDQAIGVENMRAAAQFLRDRGATKIASLGWCFGGKQSLELAMSGEELAATVVYYGGGMATTTERLAPIKWPVLGIFGDQDQVIPLAMIDDFRTSLNTLGIENEIHIYPGVGHAFANPSGMNYAPEATRDAWEKTLAFLNRNLKN